MGESGLLRAEGGQNVSSEGDSGLGFIPVRAPSAGNANNAESDGND